MLFLAAIAAATTPQAHASVRIVRPQRLIRKEWELSRHKREIIIREGGRQVILRLIELE